jgi:hypothetical protein
MFSRKGVSECERESETLRALRERVEAKMSEQGRERMFVVVVNMNN